MTKVQRERNAARVIVLDPLDRVLVLKAHDADNPSRQWWFTVGGGIEESESARAAATRELFEETGIVVGEHQLQGPVLKRTAIFDFEAEHLLQHEEFFFLKLDVEPNLTRDGWTEVEQNFVDDIAWLTTHELATQTIEVFPAELAAIVGKLITGWDGTTQHVGL